MKTRQLWRRDRPRRNSSSGLVGVARYESESGGAFWLASWTDQHGVGRKRKFSVNRWGEHLAKNKAMDECNQQMRRAVTARRGEQQINGPDTFNTP